MAKNMPEEYLEKCLKNTHVMEQKMLGLLGRQPHRYRHCPALADKIYSHWEESKTHPVKIMECLGLLNPHFSSEPVQNEDWNIISFMPGGLKNSMTQYVLEHYEISQYKMIIEAARQTGRESIARLCEEILCQEEEMAFWIEYHLPDLTRTYLELGQTDAGKTEYA